MHNRRLAFLVLVGGCLLATGLTIGLRPQTTDPYIRDGFPEGGVIFEQRERYECGPPLLRQYTSGSIKAQRCADELRGARIVAAGALAAGPAVLLLAYRGRSKRHTANDA